MGKYLFNKHRLFAYATLFLIILLILGLLFILPLNAMAAELYPGTPVSWGIYAGNNLSIVWHNYNVTGTLGSCLSGGMQYWTSQTMVTASSTTSFASAKLVHVNASQAWWDAQFNAFEVEEVYAATAIYDTNGVGISASNVASTTRLIGGANIYYSPYSVFGDFTTTNYKSLVAHEIGHALGFGHYEDTPSIMNDGKLSFTSLQTYDINEFNDKY